MQEIESNKIALRGALKIIARAQSFVLDELKFHAATESADPADTLAQTELVCIHAGWAGVRTQNHPSRERLPLMALSKTLGWGVIVDGSNEDDWLFRRPDQDDVRVSTMDIKHVLRLVEHPTTSQRSNGGMSFQDQLDGALKSFRSPIVEAVTASFLINLLAVVVGFFSMQVYDKVIPTRSNETLIVLLCGVLLLITLEWLMKWARAAVMDKAVVGLDSRLGRNIFERLLTVRLDQMPASVGSLASQLRGYEQVRSFYTASTLFALVDVPAAIIFLVIIAAIASPWLALVPFVMGIIALTVGLMFRKRVRALAKDGQREVNMKTGFLVETVEGAETIKATQAHWGFSAKWADLCAKTISNDLQMRHTNEYLNYFMAAMQQLSFVLLIALGALLVIDGSVTLGGLIACSILGGRVLAAVMMVPALIVQQANAQVAISGVEAVYKLAPETPADIQPLAPSTVHGHFRIEDIKFAYGKTPPVVNIKELTIKPGERVAILGTVGSGKSTLLRMLTGMYRPTEGRILLDNLDISHLARETLGRHMAYVQQEHRLFEGTLRQNLVMGLPSTSDDAVREAMDQTGLLDLVASHPMGLDLPISEGGKGLSGGQKQLVAFTRILLTRRHVMLLDEPTASMDTSTERRCLTALLKAMDEKTTMVLVTHKPNLLPLVNRIVVLSKGSIVMDGPAAEVLKQLNKNTASPN
jgi:ATP-binding cassette subfamily C protein LapB